MAHSMTDSSVVPIDGGAGAREQALRRDGGDSNQQPTQSSPETPKAVDNAVDDPMAKERDAWPNDTSKMTWLISAGGTVRKPACSRHALNYWLSSPSCWGH